MSTLPLRTRKLQGRGRPDPVESLREAHGKERMGRNQRAAIANYMGKGI